MAAQQNADRLAGIAAEEICRTAARRDGAVVACDGDRRFGLATGCFAVEDLGRRGEAVLAHALADDAHGLHLAAGEEHVGLAEHALLERLEIAATVVAAPPRAAPTP